MEILSPWALEEIAKALDFGKQKYGEWNYRGGFKWCRLTGSLLRHVYAWLKREDKDPETGLSHLAHAGANILMLLDHEILGLGEDNRWTKPEEMSPTAKSILENPILEANRHIKSEHSDPIVYEPGISQEWPLYPRMQK